MNCAALRPDPVPLRQGASNRLIGSSLPRLDAPSKIDGTVNYAADIRLPNMVFATVRQGPLGETRLLDHNAPAARKVAGAVDVIALPNALACVASNSWAAAKMPRDGVSIFLMGIGIYSGRASRFRPHETPCDADRDFLP